MKCSFLYTGPLTRVVCPPFFRPAQSLTHLALFPAQKVDPTQNTDTTAGAPEESLSFPFVTTEEDRVRIRQRSLADHTS